MTEVSKERLKSLKAGLMTKEVALQKIAPYEKCEEAVVTGKTTIDFHPKKDSHFIMSSHKQDFAMNEAAFYKLCRLVGITEVYAKKTPRDLLFPHIKYWIEKGGVVVKAYAQKKDKDGRTWVAGFAREDSYYYPVSRVLDVVDNLDMDYHLEGLEDISWRNTTFGVVFPQFEFEVEDPKKGDWIYGGLKIRMSLLGEFPTKLSAFLMTLTCLNGMVSANEVYVYNRKLGFDGQDAWLNDGIQMALGALSNEVERVRALKNCNLNGTHMITYINSIFDQMGVNQKSRVAVLEQIASQQPKTLYDLMNVVTSAAHVIENREEVYHLQNVGGYVVQHAESCETCHRPY